MRAIYLEYLYYRNGNKSSSDFGSAYQLPPGYVYNTEQAKNLLAGQREFVTTEIEVFK
jgi:hypothetical protein